MFLLDKQQKRVVNQNAIALTHKNTLFNRIGEVPGQTHYTGIFFVRLSVVHTLSESGLITEVTVGIIF